MDDKGRRMMGYYINPKDQTKEAFLLEQGHPVSEAALARYTFDEDTLPVCWVQNPGMTAAGIAYNQEELNRFLMGVGNRKFQWYLVPRSALAPYLPKGEVK